MRNTSIITRSFAAVIFALFALFPGQIQAASGPNLFAPLEIEEEMALEGEEEVALAARMSDWENHSPQLTIGGFNFLPSVLYVGLGGTYVEEQFDSGNVEFENTGGLQVKIGFELHQFFSLEFNFDYFPEFEGSGQNVQEETDIFTFMLVGKFPLGLQPPLIKPSLLLGGGVFHSVDEFKENLSSNTITREDTDVGISLKFGLALDLTITDNILAGGEIAFVQLFGNEDKADNNYRFVMLTAWVGYRF